MRRFRLRKLADTVPTDQNFESAAVSSQRSIVKTVDQRGRKIVYGRYETFAPRLDSMQ